MKNQKHNKLYESIKEVNSFLFPVIIFFITIYAIVWLTTEKSGWFALLIIPLIYIIMVIVSYSSFNDIQV